MSRFHSYINTAIKIIETFKGEKPFSIFLKQFFSLNKKYGSSDRRNITSLCYNHFRLGFAAHVMPPEEKMLMATFLCETVPAELLENLRPDWNKNISLPVNEKLAMLRQESILAEIFPFNNELSEGIDTTGFYNSFLIQPDIFIRIRPGTKSTVIKKLEQSTLSWRMADENCVQFTGKVNVEDFFIPDKEVVVQDLNSQKVLDYLKNDSLEFDTLQSESKINLSVWDCCAASGGKSILLYDIINRKIELTVSDIRTSILQNLHGRMEKAGIKQYKHFTADITKPGFKPPESNFDLIICDAPCTGSGTWSRTPEQLCYFKQSSIRAYSLLQKKIVANLMPYLQKGGLLIYITCSVFKKENEAIAEFILENFNCTLLHRQLLKGYDKKADNMFVAVFRKS